MDARRAEDVTAQVLNVSPVTVRRDWSSDTVWLYRELTGHS